MPAIRRGADDRRVDVLVSTAARASASSAQLVDVDRRRRPPAASRGVDDRVRASARRSRRRTCRRRRRGEPGDDHDRDHDRELDRGRDPEGAAAQQLADLAPRGEQDRAAVAHSVTAGPSPSGRHVAEELGQGRLLGTEADHRSRSAGRVEQRLRVGAPVELEDVIADRERPRARDPAAVTRRDLDPPAAPGALTAQLLDRPRRRPGGRAR